LDGLAGTARVRLRAKASPGVSVRRGVGTPEAGPDASLPPENGVLAK